MKLLLGLCTFFQLLLSSFSSFCRAPHLPPKWKEAHIRAPEQNENLAAPWLTKVFGNGKICQGVILSKWWVLTAASCFLVMKPSHVEMIGIHGHFSTITVSHFVSHWSISSWDAVPNSDLGLIRLAQPIDLERKDMWPLCVPHRKESPDVLVQCNIFEQQQTQQKGHKKWLIKRIMVHTTEISACSAQWPDTTVQWNLCVEREVSKHKDCMVPVGSPMICRDPAGTQWEFVATVSQIVHDCTAPVLATLIIPHHQWLQKELAKMNHFQPHHIKASSGKSSSPRVVNRLLHKKEVPSRTRHPAAFPKGESSQKQKHKPLRKHTIIIKSHHIKASHIKASSGKSSSPRVVNHLLHKKEVPSRTRHPAAFPKGESSQKQKHKPLRKHTITIKLHPKSVRVPVIPREEKQFLREPDTSELPPLKITKFLHVPVILPEEKQSLRVSETTELPPLKITNSLQVPVILPEEKQSLRVSLTTELPPLTNSLQVPVILLEEKQSLRVSVTTKLPPLTNSLQVPVILPEEKQSLRESVTITLPPLTITNSLQVPVILPEEKQSLRESVPTMLPPLKITNYLQLPEEKQSLRESVPTTLPPLKITNSLQLLEEKQSLSESVTTTLPPLKITNSVQLPEEKQSLRESVTTTLPPLKITKSLQLPEEKQSLRESVTTTLPPLKITNSVQLPEEKQSLRESVTTTLPPLKITKSLQFPVMLPEEKKPLSVSVNTQLLSQKTTEYTSTKETTQPTLEKHNILVTPSISQQFTQEKHIILVAFPKPQIPITATAAQSLYHITEPEHVVIIPSRVSQAPSIVSSTQIQQSSATVPTTGQEHVVIIPSTEHPQLHRRKRDIAQFPDLSIMLRAPLATAIRRISGMESPVQVTMEQCKMGLVWNSISHTFQLNKMAVLMDHRVGCGLRPRFVPKCPTCSEAEVGEFPWIVSLKLSIRHICTGSILNPKWILTTASCANLIKNSEELALAQLGLTDISEKMHSIPIHQALTHPHWLASNDLHNVGLLQLEKSLDMGPLTAPTCLLDKANMMVDFKDCWLPGWTVLEGGLAILLRHPLHILDTSNCSLFGEEHSSAIFCMKPLRGQERACKGDVGSPLICHDPQSGAWVQLGILSSFDEACSHPYVFSSLLYYLPWLESTTRREYHPTKHLRVLQEPETLIKQISAHFSMPWQVLIATCGNRSCVGSILDRYWVLTTAHCVQEVDPANTAVFVGLKHPSGQVQGIRVTGIYLHEEILQDSLAGDNTVALLLLQSPIIFDQHVTSMSFSQMESWDNCKVMGLQLLQFGEVETDPSVYQVKVLSPSECAKELQGVNPNMYCIVRHKDSHRPAAVAAVGEGAALLCRLEAKSTSWSQVGLMNKPFPGSQPVVVSSSITSYVDWMEETSKQAKHLLFLTSGREAYRPCSRILLLLLSLFGATELG